jgi:hypothetical protein
MTLQKLRNKSKTQSPSLLLNGALMILSLTTTASLLNYQPSDNVMVWFDQRVLPIYQHFAKHKDVDPLDPCVEHFNTLQF